MNTLIEPKTFTVSMYPARKQPRLVHLLDRAARRGMDVFVSLMGLWFLSPFFLFIAFLIKNDSPGPVFYRGRRVGRGGREFGILKFRTMFETPDGHLGPKLTARDDARITTVGAWLRSTKLNELPQLWNVLVGEMSLVGPRPEDPEFVKKWPEAARQELLSVRPGISSPASIIYHDEESLMTTGNAVDDYLRSILPSKLRLDQLYVRNRTLFSDLDVIFWTLVILIPQARKYKIPEAKLYWGPLSVFMSQDFRWFLVDFTVVLVSLAVIGIIWRTITPLDIGWQKAPFIAFAMASVFSLGNALRGLNRVYWAKAAAGEALDLLVTSVFATIFLWLTNLLLFPHIFVPPGLFVFGGLVAYLGFVAVRYRERLLTGLATRWLDLRGGGVTIGERLLIVGAGELGQFGAWLVRKGNLAQAFTLVGMVDDDPRKQGMRIDGSKVIGSTEDIEDLVRQQDIRIVLFAISKIEPKDKERILSVCQHLPVRIILIPNVVDMLRDEFRLGLSGAAHGRENPVSPDRMETWLQNLDALLQLGDYEAVQIQVDDLKKELARQKVHETHGEF